jgi:plasmid stabilization system protein ParE
MSCTVLFRPLAGLELSEAVMWYEARRHGLGLELKEELDASLERAAENPRRFPRVHGEVRRALLRRFPYALHFLDEPDAIVVVAVFHVRRDPRHLEGQT